MLSKSFRSRFRSARLRRPRLECLASGAPPRAISLELFASSALQQSEHPKANQHTPPAAQHITEKEANSTWLLSSLLERHGRRFGLPHGGGIVLIRFSVRGYRFKVKCCCRPRPIQSLCPEFMEPADSDQNHEKSRHLTLNISKPAFATALFSFDFIESLA